MTIDKINSHIELMNFNSEYVGSLYVDFTRRRVEIVK